jgi:hypothetical protein
MPPECAVSYCSSPTPARGCARPFRASALVLAVDMITGIDSRALRLLQVRESLVRLLQHFDVADTQKPGREPISEIEQAYRRALRSQRPSYEYVRFRFGQSEDLESERLVLSAAFDGQTVSHLFGLVMMPERVFEGD